MGGDRRPSQSLAIGQRVDSDIVNPALSRYYRIYLREEREMRHTRIRWVAMGLMALVLGAGCRNLRGPWCRAETAEAQTVTEAAPANPGKTSVDPENEGETKTRATPVRYVRRPHLKFRNEQEIGEYQAAAAQAKENRDTLRALRRMLMEKGMMLRAISDTLNKEYQLKEGGRYEWNDMAKTVVEVAQDGQTGESRRVVLTLTDPDAAAKVVRLLDARKTLLSEARSLQMERDRRENTLLLQQTRMSLEYGVAWNRDYVVDSRRRLLIERVPVPKRFELAGDREDASDE